MVTTKDLQKQIAELTGLVLLLSNKIESIGIATDEVMTAKQVADMLGVQEKTVRNWVSKNSIPYKRQKGKGTYFLRSEIISHIKESEVTQ